MIGTEDGKTVVWVFVAASLNSLKAMTLIFALSNPRVSPPAPLNKLIAVIGVGSVGSTTTFFNSFISASKVVKRVAKADGSHFFFRFKWAVKWPFWANSFRHVGQVCVGIPKSLIRCVLVILECRSNL
jgi:hypothetical protein